MVHSKLVEILRRGKPLLAFLQETGDFHLAFSGFFRHLHFSSELVEQFYQGCEIFSGFFRHLHFSSELVEHFYQGCEISYALQGLIEERSLKKTHIVYISKAHFTYEWLQQTSFFVKTIWASQPFEIHIRVSK